MSIQALKHHRQLWIGLFILIAACVCYWQASHHQQRHTRRDLDKLPDNYMVNLVSQHLDTQGRPQKILQATKLTHYPAGDRIIISRPVLKLFHGDKAPWLIRSQAANTTSKQQQIELNHDVNITQTLEGGGQTEITTSKLIVYPDKKFAETHVSTTLKQPGTVIHSNGVKAYFDSGKIELLSQTNGEPYKQ